MSRVHGIDIYLDKCTGCTHCIRVCPTEAIRVKDRKANIIEDKCINCGQCINSCPFNALYGITDSMDNNLDQSKFQIALIDPAFYSQFNINLFNPQNIIDKLFNLGFNWVYEVTRGSSIITNYTKKIIDKSEHLPIISSSCPTVIRTIQIRFPDLIKHILPIDSPAEISAQLAKDIAVENFNIKKESIEITYISTCPARSFSFEKPLGREKSNIDRTLSIKDMFIQINNNHIYNKKQKVLNYNFYSSGRDIGWARLGGQSQSLSIKEFLAVDGINNVINIFEEVEENNLTNLKFLECQACTNGCVGGTFCIENSFVARNRIRILSEQYQRNTLDKNFNYDKFILKKEIKPQDVTSLDSDLSKAIKKLKEIENILNRLPNINCGACGSPSCRALAEDIINNISCIDDCLVLLREKKNKRGDSKNV